MIHRARLKLMVIWAYKLLLRLYPSKFRTRFGDEMLSILTAVLNEQDGEHPLYLFWREIRNWPGSVLKAHLRRRIRNMTPNKQPLPQRELLAAMIIFLLPIFSLTSTTGANLPEWTNYILLVLFWGSLLFALVLAVAKKMPGWSHPYLGFVLMLGIVVSPVLPRVAAWIYPYFLETFGARSSWSLAVSIFYGGIFEFMGALTILLGALVFVNLLRLIPFTRRVWERIRADWTQLSFLIYGGLVFTVILLFDEYRYDELWKISAWACLALGAWLYLRGKNYKQRILALLGGTTGAFWIVALAKWLLIPFQKWPTGYPIAPSVTSRWVETGNTLLSWLFILGILCAPILTHWLPPSPKPIPSEQEEPVNLQAA